MLPGLGVPSPSLLIAAKLLLEVVKAFFFKSMDGCLVPYDLVVLVEAQIFEVLQCVVRLELASGSGQGPPGGRLRVYTAAGKLAASSSSPGNEEVLRYSREHQAFLWTASAQWSLLFSAQETAAQFEGDFCNGREYLRVLFFVWMRGQHDLCM